jgi:hypothetical protein
LNQKIAIDSNSHTYLVEAVYPNYEPEKDSSRLLEERKSMVRIFLYKRQPFYVLPAVIKEYKRIKDERWREEHDKFTKNLLLDHFIDMDEDKILTRKNYFISLHNKEVDCQILAEAEAARMNLLLSCDQKFIKRLGTRARGVEIMKPTEYFNNLDIAPGTKPIWRPGPSNPLSKKTWWKI